MKTKIFLFAFLMISTLALFSQWSTDPSVNNALGTVPGEEAIPKVATSASGITYVSWLSVEASNYNVRLQKLDVYGVALWSPGGILISDHPQESWLTDWDMTVDQDDHAILVWNDIRTGNWDVFAYRISPDGDFVWGDDGIQLSSGPDLDVAPKVTVTNAGNAIVAWQDMGAGDIIGQKIDPDGNLQWGPNGLTLGGSNTFTWPQLMPAGDDDVIMKYFEDSGPVWAPTRHVYALRFSSSGTWVWPAPAVISEAGGISAWTQIFPFVNDGNDGFYIAWHDDRDNNMLSNMWLQHIGNDGSVLLADDGVEVTTALNRNHFYAHLALPQGSEDIFIFWNEMDANQNDRGIYGQRIDAAGNRLWTDNGKPFIELSSQDVYPIAARSSGNDVAVFYEINPTFTNATIKAMKMDPNGNLLWTPAMVDLCSMPSTKGHAEVGELNSGQWIAVWEDNRSGNPDIYAQNIQLDGSLGPVTITYYLDVYPDSLWFNDYQSTTDGQYFTIKNNAPVPFTIMNIPLSNTLPGWMWEITDFTGSFPLTLNPGDSLNMLVNIYFPAYSPELFDYVYDIINIELEVENYTVTVCLNTDLLNRVADRILKNEIKCYPAPFSDRITFEFSCEAATIGELTILNTQGSIILKTGKFNCNSGKNTYHWDGKTNSGKVVPAGVYTYQLKLNDRIITGKIVKSLH